MSNDVPEGVEVDKGGRPTIYSEAIADEICIRLACGESLRRVCKDDHLPAIKTVMLWLMKDTHEGFLQQYTQARTTQAEYLVDEIIDIADDSINDYTEGDDERVNYENINRARLRVDARKWSIEKLAPKRYGAKQQIESNVNLSVNNLTDDELDAQIAALSNGKS